MPGEVEEKLTRNDRLQKQIAINKLVFLTFPKPDGGKYLLEHMFDVRFTYCT